MSGHRLAFFELRVDRRTTRLADGTIVYSDGLGSYGCQSILCDVLYVPCLTTSFFSSDQFATVYRHIYRGHLDFPTRERSIAALKLLDDLL